MSDKKIKEKNNPNINIKLPATWTIILGGIISPIGLLMSLVADFIGVLQNWRTALYCIIIILAIVVIVYSVNLLRINKINRQNILEFESLKGDLEESKKIIAEDKKEILQKEDIISDYKREILKYSDENLQFKNSIAQKEKETSELKKNIEELEVKICDGKKYISSKATIEFDLSDKKYHLSFEKRYLILSEAIKWYEGQFYSNKYLANAKQSNEYYKANPVSWKELNIRAQLRFKNKGKPKFSKSKEVSVLEVAEGANYKKFHIQYQTLDGKDNLQIKQGAEIILNYSYEVPVELWGSYLNRYISYWKEETEVSLKCKDEKKINDKNNFKVYQTDDKTGKPFIVDDDVLVLEEDIQNGDKILKIKLPDDKCGKFSIWWDAEKIFNLPELNTDMTADHSQLTQY